MKTIVNKIADLFTQSTGLQLIYQTEEMVNVKLDTTPLPCGWWYCLADTQVVSGSASGQICEKVQCRIYVGDLNEYDFNGLEAEEIISDCRNYIFQFINALRKSSELNLESINTNRRFYLENDVIVTGYMADLTITEVNGFNVCTNQ